METTIITKASIEDLDLVNEFLIANFFSREPLGVRMGIDPERDTRSWISMVSCLSFHGEKLVAVCLNKLAYSDPKKNIPSFSEAVQGKNIFFMNEILALMDEVYKDVDLFKESNEEQMLVINMLCVSSEMAGQGLGLKMMEWSENLAKEKGISLMTAETTGVASGRLFQKAGFQKVKELEYDAYTNKKGEKPFFALEPHKACVVWKKQLLP